MELLHERPVGLIDAARSLERCSRFFRVGCRNLWFLVSFGAGIIWVEELNTIRLGGFKLGFWISQQGSIFVFIALIFIYIRAMDKLDSQYKQQPIGGDIESSQGDAK